MIRVLQIVTYMGRGGLETMLMNYYRHVDRNQIQFDFLVHRDFEADYDQEILAMGGRIYHISRLIPWSGEYRKKLKRFFREHPEYQIVHVHQDCLSSVALQCAKECNVCVRIAHSHTTSQDKNLKYLIKQFYMKQIPSYATDFFACSKSAGEWMFGGHSFRILFNAIDIEKFRYSTIVAERVRRELKFTKDDFVIGHVGRFNPPKNHSFLVDIFAECVKRNKNVKLLLVGDGDGKKNIQDKVKAMEIQDKVIFAGVRTDVNELLQAMDVFVFPSLYEGLGISVIEAQAAGLHCVISDAVPDDCIITQNLVEKVHLADPAYEWAEIIMERRKIQRNGYADMVKAAGYDITDAAKKLEKFYLSKYVECQENK